MKKRLTFSGIILIFFLGLTHSMAATPPKAGTTCAKFGQIKVYSGKKFTCIKSNSKLVWSKGVIVTKFQANSTVSPSTTPLPSVTPVSKPNPSPSPSATNSLSEPSFIQSEELASAEACKLTDRRINKSLNFDHYERNNGFPLQGATLPTSGKARFLTILVDFSDAPGTQEDLLRLRAQEKYFTQWFKEVSNGKLEVEIRSVDTWFRAPKPSSNYELTGANYGKHPDFAQEFVNLTGNSFNWFDVNTFMIHFPDSQKTRFQSAQLGRNVLIRTPQGNQVLNYQYYGVWQHETARMFAKKYPNYWAGQWIHESLHDLGLTLHAPGNGLNTGVGQSQASYSLMLDAWEQFKLGWITDKEVFCAPKSKLTSSIIYLNPLEEIPSGYRVLVIPTSDQEALVVESRRPKGLSSAWPESMRGIFVYRINTSVVTDRSQEFNGSGLDNGNNPKYAKWAFYLNSDQKQIDSTLPSSKLDPEKFYQEWIIREGETVSADGVKISFLTSSLKDIIQISRI